MKWENCKKCPKELCETKKNSFVSFYKNLYNCAAFTMIVHCGDNQHYAFSDEGRTHITFTKLIDSIDYCLSIPKVSFEDSLRLTKIKLEL